MLNPQNIGAGKPLSDSSISSSSHKFFQLHNQPSQPHHPYIYLLHFYLAPRLLLHWCFLRKFVLPLAKPIAGKDLMKNPHYYWYVAVTYRKERIIKEELDKMNIKNFVPFRETVVERNGKKIKLSKLVIPGYVFIYSDRQQSIELTQKLNFSMRYLKDPKTYQPVIVPEKQMQDFIFLLTFPEEQTELVPCNFKRGDRVRIIKGDFAGIEGELIRMKSHKRVVVRLEGVVAVATTYVPASFLERVEAPEHQEA